MREWCKKKKLIEAARYWAAGGNKTDKAEIHKAASAFGIATDQIDLLLDDEAESVFYVFEKNGLSWDAFLMVQTQWQLSFGRLVGLNYLSVFKTWEVSGMKKKQQRKCFADLQVIESAILEELSKHE